MYYVVVVARQYQCSQLPGKTRPFSNLSCVEWDDKLYLLCASEEIKAYQMDWPINGWKQEQS